MSGSKTLSTIGFLTVVDHPQHGWIGGYLVLNSASRPLEFHCTAPVKPNRAQEILYGPTLWPFLFGEQIGQALVGRSKLNPLLICTDVEPVLALRPLVTSPVVWVDARCAAPHGAAEAAATGGTEAPAVATGAGLLTFSLGRFTVAVPAGGEADRQAVLEHWPALGDAFDLVEPFGRIREAISEAQRAAA